MVEVKRKSGHQWKIGDRKEGEKLTLPIQKDCYLHEEGGRIQQEIHLGKKREN